MDSTKHAFTLIELLSVIALILVLAGMLLPVIGKTLSRARSVTCANNLRQLLQAFTLYADEWGGRLPPYVTAASNNEHPGINWAGWSYPYHQSIGILRCPATSGKEPVPTAVGFRAYDGSYAWNYDGTQGNRGPLSTHIKIPSAGYLIVDSGDQCLIYGGNNWDNLMEELDLDWDSQAEGANRHNSEVNCGFVDGHVEMRGLDAFIAAPCPSYAPPWYMPWDDGALQLGTIPFPNR